MKFRTEVTPHPLPVFDQDTSVLSLGSCFSENIGQRLQRYGFRCVINPFGILFHPSAIAQLIARAIGGNPFTQSDTIENEGRWYLWDAHGRISHIEREALLVEANQCLDDFRLHMRASGRMLITFGTAWVFHLKEDHRLVANCHKIPADHFTRTLSALEDMRAQWKAIIASMHQLNPDLNIVFTVSPVRHWRDGAEGNSLSKATLRVLVDSLCQEENCHYFPSYEIMMDDLRDYRFYKDDMLHPTDQAVAYIWEKFSQASLTDEAARIGKEHEKHWKRSQHRPLHS